MTKMIILSIFIASLLHFLPQARADGVLGCGGFVKSDVEINFSLVEVKLYTPHGSIKYQTDCAPNTGYYLIPLYDKGDFILKVEPPKGWTFEPESIELHVDGTTDKCSKGEDINFRFTGFSIQGKVVSAGRDTGPEGVDVSLFKSGSSDILQNTQTGADGSYQFSQVLPGDYTVKAKHGQLKFKESETAVKVSGDNVNVGSSLIIAGYAVTGKVYSEGEPIKGVNFLLFSKTVQQKDVSECKTTPVSGFVKSGDLDPLCHVTSGADGGFEFPCVPPGEFNIVPFYKGEHITFDVSPEKLDIMVQHSSTQLQHTFQVEGFSVTGLVVDAPKGNGVLGAKILLNGKSKSVTGADGVYYLENMKTGTYKLQASMDHVFFQEMEVKITPNTPQLPDIVADSFSVCGKITIDKIPEGLTQVSSKRRLIVFPEGKGSDAVSLSTNEDGTFCTERKPGKHVIRVHLTDQETKAGLQLSPSEHTVTVTNKPVLDVTFSQFRAKVSGSINCIEKCGPIEVSLEAVGRGEKQIAQARENQKDATFTFDNVMPGKYKVTLLRDSWCWKDKTLEFDVVNQNVDRLQFTQTGYILKCTISHEITLNFAHEKKEGTVGSFQLNKGKNRFCLAQPGKYHLTPDSCHKFEKDVYTYDTGNPESLTLTAVKHLMQGSVTTGEPVGDIIVMVRSSHEMTPDTQIGPLTTETKLPEGNASKQDIGKTFVYKFTHWARSGERLEISAASSELLYTPAKVDVLVQGDSCPGEVAKLTGKKGVFVVGQVKPALSGVNIKVVTEETDMTPVSVMTEEDGKFRIGPLHSDFSYNVLAEKEGYVLAKEDGETIVFKAFKLGKVAVQIIGESEEPLSEVLLSLSGGKQYRSNNVTGAEGSMNFNHLSPGQYFLRPMMKEYKFEPPSQMIDVLEGTTMDIKIKGVRVAFSCYGQVTSLNGEPEPGVVIEAVGQNDCSLYLEESKTEQNGNYRIRGLQPNCTYEVRLKIGEMNRHIERAAPKSRLIQVDKEDFAGVNIIAFRRMNQMDISGNVVTDAEYLPTLKVRLYREDNPGVPLHTVPLGVVSFFYLPSLQIDDQKYTIRLESSLSKNTHEFQQSEVELTANVSYKHITFYFDPKRKSLDQELSQGSILVLPFTILLIFAAYNYQKLLPFALDVYQHLQQAVTNRQGMVAPPVEQEPNIQDSPAGRKKSKPRKT